MQEATLCFVVRGGEVLLIEKRRGLGAGWYNGPGGKLEAGETPRECVIREVREEVGIEVGSGVRTETDSRLEKVGELTFTLDGEGHTFCHVFRTEEYDGEPTTSPEAHPVWFPLEDVPYDRMWEDDSLWLPGVLAGRSVRGTFAFEGGEPLDDAAFVDHDLEWDVSFDAA